MNKLIRIDRESSTREEVKCIELPFLYWIPYMNVALTKKKKKKKKDFHKFFLFRSYILLYMF